LNITLISSTNENDSQIRSSYLWKDSNVIKINATIDEDKFKPLSNRNTLKIKYKLNNDKVTILTGAKNFGFRRKGFSYLVDTLKFLVDTYPSIENYIEIIVIGDHLEKYIPKLPIGVIDGGLIKDESSLIELFNVSDIFLSPSIEDAGPIMINQSLMCGTPVLAFNIGVAPDFLVDGFNGYLAKNKDVTSMANFLYEFIILDEEQKNILRINARNTAINNFSNTLMQNKLKFLLS
jgi:glycosyltransferase involved in cell wall biosynthesis